jgi:hypothetical protein
MTASSAIARTSAPLVSNLSNLLTIRTSEGPPDPSISMIQEEVLSATLFANSNLFVRCRGTSTARADSCESRVASSVDCRRSNQNQPVMVELKPATFFV